MAHRSFRFRVVPMETCLTILYRVQPIPDTLQSISGVDPPHHCKLAVINPRILDHRLSRVRSATDAFVLVDSLAEAFVCIHLGTAFLSLLRHARGQSFNL